MNVWKVTGTIVSGDLTPSEGSTLELCTLLIPSSAEGSVLKAGLQTDHVVFLVLRD